jgi:hypothetical protein
MEGSAEYLAALGDALDARAAWLEATLIPSLRDGLAAFQLQFEGVTAVLIRKGLMREDPYNYEQAFTDIVLPSDQDLPEFENSDEVSYRLAAFRRQLKYVTTEYPLDMASLGLARLKRLSALILYVNWLEFGEGSKSPTTRAFARSFMKVRMGSDSMAAQILKDSETQIMKTVRQVRAQVADLISWNRESWKADLRRAVLGHMPLVTPNGRMRKAEAQRLLRRGFLQKRPGKPWYPALADEVFDEELADDGVQRRQKILAALAVPVMPAVPAMPAAPAPEKEPGPSTAPGGKQVLLEAVRLIARPHEEIATALAVVEENERMLQESSASTGWLWRLLGRGGSKHAGERVYKVPYDEPGAAEPKTEQVDLAQFLADAQKKTTLLGALSAGSGPAWKKLEATGDQQLAAFVDRQLNDLLLIHRRLGSINSLFQARASSAKKTARGVKVELLTLKNAIVKANKKRHEYQGVH